jgi:tetratricopeptide (TPR) repeat protein
MGKSLQERTLELRDGLVRHVRAYFRAEESLAAALEGIFKACHHFLRRISAKAPDHNRKHAVHWVKKGVEYYNTHEWMEAERQFQRAIEHDPTYARAWAYLGNTCYHRGRLTEAVTAWNRAIEAEPRSDAAAMAREKLLTVGHGAEGLVATIKEQMRAR